MKKILFVIASFAILLMYSELGSTQITRRVTSYQQEREQTAQQEQQSAVERFRQLVEAKKTQKITQPSGASVVGLELPPELLRGAQGITGGQEGDGRDTESAQESAESNKYHKPRNDHFILRYPQVQEEDFEIAQKNNLEITVEFDESQFMVIKDDPLKESIFNVEKGVSVEGRDGRPYSAVKMLEYSSFEGPILADGESVKWWWRPDGGMAQYPILSTQGDGDAFKITYTKGTYYAIAQRSNGSRTIQRFKVDPDVWHEFKVEMQEDDIVVIIDGEQKVVIKKGKWKNPGTKLVWSGRGILDDIIKTTTDQLDNTSPQKWDFTVSVSEILQREGNEDQYDAAHVEFMKWMRERGYDPVIKNTL